MARIDSLRDRWETITPREQRLVLALGVTFVVVILVWVGLRISDGLSAIEARNDQARMALRTLHNYRLAQSEQPRTPEVDLENNPVKLESYLESIASEVGIEIPRFNSVSPATRDGFVETSTQIEIRKLSIEELKDFLERVEGRSKKVVVRSLNIKRQFNDNEKLDVKMTVSTFAREKKAQDATPDSQEG